MNLVNLEIRTSYNCYLVDNEAGVLARVAGLFSGRGYNIESLLLQKLIKKHISRITMLLLGTVRSLNKLNYN